MSTLREIGIRLDEAHRWNANRVHHVGAPVKGEWGYDRITALEQQHAEAALRAETPPAPIRELFEQASGKRNLNYLDDLRHDLHDEEFRYQYLSACAMDGGDSLRIGIRDVLTALAQQSRAETQAPREPSDDAIVGQYFEVMAERLGRGYDIDRYGKKLEWSVWKEALKRATRAAGEPEYGEWLEKLEKKKALETAAPSNSCNRHSDCRKADEEAKGRGARAASHCHDDECEDCFSR